MFEKILKTLLPFMPCTLLFFPAYNAYVYVYLLIMAILFFIFLPSIVAWWRGVNINCRANTGVFLAFVCIGTLIWMGLDNQAFIFALCSLVALFWMLLFADAAFFQGQEKTENAFFLILLLVSGIIVVFVAGVIGFFTAIST